MIQSYEDVIAYKNSKKLFIVVARLVKTFPREGQHLASQMMRAANSIHANIAEGFGKSPSEFRRTLTISLGEANEIRCHIDDVKAIKFIKETTADKLLEKYTIVAKQVYRLKENWK